MLTWVFANIVYIGIAIAVYITGFSFSMGYIQGKKYYYYDEMSRFWSTIFWPLFWVLELLWLSGPFLKWPAWYLIIYSPFWLAYDLGMYLSGARRNKE
jgi:hypothetical protein